MSSNKLSNYIKGVVSGASPAKKKFADYIDVPFEDVNKIQKYKKGGDEGDIAAEVARSNKKALGALGATAAAGAGGMYLMDEDTKKEAEEYLKTPSKKDEPPTPPPEEDGKGEWGASISARAPVSKEKEDMFKQSEVDFKATVSDPIDQAEEYELLDQDFKNELARAQTAYEQTKNSDAAKALYEGIIRGIGHLAAGVYGLRTGLNLGGMQFDKTDWEAKQRANREELQQAINKAKDVRIVKGEKLDRAYQRSLDKLKQNQQLNEMALSKATTDARLEDAAKERQLRQYIENQRAIEAMLDRAAKGKDSKTVDKIKQLEKLEKRLFDLNKAYGKKETEETLELLKTETQRYQTMAKELGLPAGDYNLADYQGKPEWFFGMLGGGKPDANTIEERRRERMAGTSADDIVYVTVNGVTRKGRRGDVGEVLRQYPDAEVSASPP